MPSRHRRTGKKKKSKSVKRRSARRRMHGGGGLKQEDVTLLKNLIRKNLKTLRDINPQNKLIPEGNALLINLKPDEDDLKRMIRLINKEVSSLEKSAERQRLTSAATQLVNLEPSNVVSQQALNVLRDANSTTEGLRLSTLKVQNEIEKIQVRSLPPLLTPVLEAKVAESGLSVEELVNMGLARVHSPGLSVPQLVALGLAGVGVGVAATLGVQKKIKK